MIIKTRVKIVLCILLLLQQSCFTAGFAVPVVSIQKKPLENTRAPNLARGDGNVSSCPLSAAAGPLLSMSVLPATVSVLLRSMTPASAEAISSTSSGVVPSAIYAYGHLLSIMAITGCLAAERVLVKSGMSLEEENLVVRLDLLYGIMAALLIGSGVTRANTNGDFYIHEVLFWVKMALSGIWGGLSIFPSLTFYKRNFARKNNETVPPLSDPLAARLQQIINAELFAILSIPILATLMARGVSYWQDLPWQLGLGAAMACTGGSFFVYGKQALNWEEE